MNYLSRHLERSFLRFQSYEGMGVAEFPRSFLPDGEGAVYAQRFVTMRPAQDARNRNAEFDGPLRVV